MKKAILGKSNTPKKPAKANLNGTTFRPDNTPVYNTGDINQYIVGQNKLIKDKKLQLKNIQTFNGRQGIGVSADIYFMGKPCGTFLDEANGAEYYHDWNYNCVNADAAGEYLKSLPRFSDVEWKEAINSEVESYDTNKQNNGWKWYWADCLIDDYEKNKCYAKWLKKVVIFNTKTKKIEHYKMSKSDLTKVFSSENGLLSGRQYFSKLGIILNDLPKQEAYDYFNQYK
tara:strand:- start:13354 stop:14037 length:684 start_codon:yes stop_codon:yes gene_type:complete